MHSLKRASVVFPQRSDAIPRRRCHEVNFAFEHCVDGLHM